MRARGRTVAAFVVAVAAAAASCDWRDFDELQKTTPVQAIKAPSNYSAGDDFGPIILPLAPPADGSAAGRFIATAMNRTSVAVMYFDSAGNVRGDGVTNEALSMLDPGTVTAIAAIPGGTEVLLGSPFGSAGAVLHMNLTPPGYQTTTFQNVLEELFGVGVAAGNFVGAAAPEYVVLSSTTVHLYVDVVPPGTGTEHTYVWSGASDPCPISFSSTLLSRDQADRAVMVASLLGTGTQIAVGTPATGGPGHVSIFDVDASGNLTCAATLTATDSHFGRSMATVDLLKNVDGTPGGDGVPDHLLVGAPPAHAYLYKLPLTSGQAPAMSVTDPMGGGDFGAAVTAFDIDGKPGDEMFVGDPDATVNGTTTAGRVTIYTTPAMTMVPATTVPNPLAMHEPKAGNGYGSAIASMTFCPGNIAPSGADGGAADAGGGGSDAGASACVGLPLIGSLSRVYAYFTLKKPDPRAK